MNDTERVAEQQERMLKRMTADRKQLLPARNVRAVVPRVCATCAYGSEGGSGVFVCERESGLHVDTEDMTHWFTVCDLHKVDPHIPYPSIEE